MVGIWVGVGVVAGEGVISAAKVDLLHRLMSIFPLLYDVVVSVIQLTKLMLLFSPGIFI